MHYEKEPIHIIFICDETYVMPTAVAITSLCMNKRPDTLYSVHILACDISYSSQLLLQKLEKDTVQIEVLNQTPPLVLKECVIDNLHVSTAALYKFNIANLFQEYDKALYLDGDILIKKDLTDLYETNITNAYAAVVKDYKPMTYNPPQVSKLGINHKCYFNSGVMLLNLKKFREDDIFHKLLDYRLHGINYFMDQDALNVVFSENVVYLSFFYNVMSSVMGYFKIEEILEYYELTHVESKDKIYEEATIVHLCTKYKPWSYFNVPFADEWTFYYNYSGIVEPLNRRKLEITLQKKMFSELGYKMTRADWNIPNGLIVSLTSFPTRIHFVPKVIESILSQTVKADKILLWLAEEQFPNKEGDLPAQLIEQLKCGLDICWCDDLKPHKKYYYAMRNFPDHIVVTVDDDVIYPNNLIETLLESYVKYPYAVSAMRAHFITFGPNGNILPYEKWKREYRRVGEPSMALCATGVGGILYPPNIMNNELFNKDAIKKLCIYADDLWLKVMQVIACTPVVIAAPPQKLVYIDGSQEEALWRMNDLAGANDTQLSNILEYYNAYWGGNDTIMHRMYISSLNMRTSRQQSENATQLQKDIKAAKKEIKAIQRSWSFRIGRFVTFIPRKLRGGIRCYQEHGFQYTLSRIKLKVKHVIGVKI